MTGSKGVETPAGAMTGSDQLALPERPSDRAQWAHDLARSVEPEHFAAAIAALLGGDQARHIAAIFALPEHRDLRLVGVVAGMDGLSSITTSLSEARSSYPAVSAVVPGAGFYERAIHDLYGIEPVGHPELDPLVLARPPGVRPPRPGSGEPVTPITQSTEPFAALISGEGMFTLSYGPVRSGVHEAVEYLLETPGEDLPRVRVRPHYKHRGVEAAFWHRSASDGALLAERVEGIASVAHSIAYCEALERIAGAIVPEPAQLVRVLHAELERIANHLDSTVRHVEAAGQAVAYARFGVHKERVMRLRAELCGSRFGRGVVVPGGVSRAPSLDAAQVRAAIDELQRPIEKELRALMVTPSFLDRLRTTGALSRQLVEAYGALGPLGRASGIDQDVRSSRPYGAYRQLGFTPARHDEGDALARQVVRNDEITSSFHLLRQVIDALETAFREANWSSPLERASGEAFGWAEAPQGEVLYLVALEDDLLTQVKARSASFHNLALFAHAFPKDITTDFAFIEASFGLSVAGVAG